MKEIKNRKSFWIAHNNDKVVHFGGLKEGRKVQTGQPFLEEFEDEELWKKRVIELGGDFEDEEEK